MQGKDAINKAFGDPFGTLLDIVLVAIFLAATTLLNTYALSKLNNVIRALIATRCFTSAPVKGGKIPAGQEPMVTIQICCYNEGNVIEDTINAACAVDWPKDKLCVQVLDDSNDETIMIAEAVCRRWREQHGMNCHRLTRPDRIGYKAGNLHHHTPAIQGDFVGMFDADHRCENQFLRRAVSHFFDQEGSTNERIGLVQCPWAYYNAHSNILTEYDALNLDMSFVLEQTARYWALGVFGFNGTGGIWRKSAIQAGGGWSWETITEDLDLSYEAYLAGYEFVYLRDLPQQLEVPAGMRAHIQQKFRWTKGYWQVTRKTLWRILQDSNAPRKVKLEAFFQYTGSVAYALTLFLVLLAPILSFRDLFSPVLISYTIAPSLVALFGAICTIFGKVSGSDGSYRSFSQRLGRLRFIPFLFALALGMMVFETYAIYEGLTSDDATFVRTPKAGTPIDGDQRVDYEDEDEDAKQNINLSIDPDLEKDIGMETGSSEDEDGSIQTISSKASDYPGDTAPIEPTPRDTRRGAPKSYSCLPELSKKGGQFRTNLLNGLAGLVIAGYLFGWCVWLYLLKRQQPGGISILEYFLVVMLPLPSIGLCYIHGTFVYQLLSSKFRKWSKRRKQQQQNAKRVQGPSLSLLHLFCSTFLGDKHNFDKKGAGDTVSTDNCSQLAPLELSRRETSSTASEVFYPRSTCSRSQNKIDSTGNFSLSSVWSDEGYQTDSFCAELDSSPCYPLDELESPMRLPDQESLHISGTMPDLTTHHSPVRRRLGLSGRIDSSRSTSTFASFAMEEDSDQDLRGWSPRRLQPRRNSSTSTGYRRNSLPMQSIQPLDLDDNGDNSSKMAEDETKYQGWSPARCKPHRRLSAESVGKRYVSPSRSHSCASAAGSNPGKSFGLPFLVEEISIERENRVEIQAAIRLQAFIRGVITRTRILEWVEEMIVELKEGQSSHSQVSWNGRPCNVASGSFNAPDEEEQAAVRIQAFVRSALTRLRVSRMVDAMISRIFSEEHRSFDFCLFQETVMYPHSRREWAASTTLIR